MELELILNRDLLPPTMQARSKTQLLPVDFDMSPPVPQVGNHLQEGRTRIVVKTSFPDENGEGYVYNLVGEIKCNLGGIHLSFAITEMVFQRHKVLHWRSIASVEDRDLNYYFYSIQTSWNTSHVLEGYSTLEHLRTMLGIEAYDIRITVEGIRPKYDEILTACPHSTPAQPEFEWPEYVEKVEAPQGLLHCRPAVSGGAHEGKRCVLSPRSCHTVWIANGTQDVARAASSGLGRPAGGKVWSRLHHVGIRPDCSTTQSGGVFHHGYGPSVNLFVSNA